MRFGRLSTTDDDETGRKALPIRLPLMKRNRQSAQDAKENVPPEGMDDHEKATASPKASRRRTVIDFFKHKSGHKAEVEPENILERMSTHRTKSVGSTLEGIVVRQRLANIDYRVKANTDDTAVLTA
jgi:hypothetical protein